MKIEVVVCNVCQAPDRPTEQYEVRKDGASGTVDLCEEHAAPFQQVLTHPKVTPPRKTARRTRGIEVTPLDQVR